ncbi:MAG: hypothetical protein AABX89_02560 [Candidatus Thermoplasmatota archaeon]
MWLKILGVVLTLTAILGFIPALVDVMHNLTINIEGGELVLHMILAGLTFGLAFGVKDDAVLATLTIVYGAVYLLVGVFGFAVSSIGDLWHVGLGDNLLHLALGGVTLVAGMASRNRP